jgi:hypothetical protein
MFLLFSTFLPVCRSDRRVIASAETLRRPKVNIA